MAHFKKNFFIFKIFAAFVIAIKLSLQIFFLGKSWQNLDVTEAAVLCSVSQIGEKIMAKKFFLVLAVPVSRLLGVFEHGEIENKTVSIFCFDVLTNLYFIIGSTLFGYKSWIHLVWGSGIGT